jgi:hypothetical protein
MTDTGTKAREVAQGCVIYEPLIPNIFNSRLLGLASFYSDPKYFINDKTKQFLFVTDSF